MAITEESRQDLFQLFESTYGREGALLIMEYLPPVGWADVATKRDLDAQTALLSRDIEGAKQELRAEISGLEVRMLNAFGSQTKAMVIGLTLALVGMVATAVGLG